MVRRIRFARALVAFAHDVVMAAVSFTLALWLRLGDGLGYYPVETVAIWIGLFTVTAAGAFWIMRLYSGVWRYASMADFVAILKAVSLAVLLFLPLMFFITRLDYLPRSTPLIVWFVLILALGGPRILYRLLKDRGTAHIFERGDRVPVLLVGAGDGAELFIRAMQGHRSQPYQVVGVVDEKGTRVGRRIRGVEVLCDIAGLPRALARLGRRNLRPQRLVVAKDLDGPLLRELLGVAEAHGMTLSRLPDLTEFKSSDPERVVTEIRPVAIEDLLGRPQTALDRAAMAAALAGRRVLVTGAGGTIGGELCRQVAEFGPARLVLVDNGEFNLYRIDQEIGERAPDLDRAAVLADVRDRERIDAVIAAERPEVVCHAAALKHVPMVEANPCEGVLTNVVGTRHVADACQRHGVAVMVQISTDKAVNPTNVMGASKRLAEAYCQALDVSQDTTRFVTVRFGNVLGSTGSVVPLFQRQLAAGGPLTVTHPDITRYFMTVREAVELVLEAAVLRQRDAATEGKLFVLDMGEPVRIADLARQMIRLAGLRPDRDVDIVYTGLRPGEKLYEELFHDGEALKPTAFDGILLAAPRAADIALLSRACDELAAEARAGHPDRALAVLRRVVPELQPSAAAKAAIA